MDIEIVKEIGSTIIGLAFFCYMGFIAYTAVKEDTVKIIYVNKEDLPKKEEIKKESETNDKTETKN